jgi:hypothetical protein
MKKFLLGSFLVVGLVVFTACSGDTEATVGQYTSVEYEAIYDAGTVAKGEIVKAKIGIKNVGDYPLVIANVKPACSCTVPSYDTDPVAPGETAYINAEVDTDKTGKGIINKPITITANTRPSTTKVTIKATVID